LALQRFPLVACYDSTVIDTKPVELTLREASPPVTAALAAALVQFQALADPTRLKIIEALGCGERCACELGTAVTVPANLLSHHLKVLRRAGLIVGTRRGRWIDYRLRSAAFRELQQLLAGVEGATPDSPMPQLPTRLASLVR
jgi:ArsR family transcriptional regulator